LLVRERRFGAGEPRVFVDQLLGVGKGTVPFNRRGKDLGKRAFEIQCRRAPSQGRKGKKSRPFRPALLQKRRLVLVLSTETIPAPHKRECLGLGVLRGSRAHTNDFVMWGGTRKGLSVSVRKNNRFCGLIVHLRPLQNAGRDKKKRGRGGVKRNYRIRVGSKVNARKPNIQTERKKRT